MSDHLKRLQAYGLRLLNACCPGLLFLVGLSTLFTQQSISTMTYNNPSTTIVTVPQSSSFMVSEMATGATHTQYSADTSNNASAVAAAKQIMQQTLHYQNQQIMGWGADDPEPSPGVYNWSSLDERVQLMRSTHATMVLTLCGAPGWMRPAGYQDDWKYLETAPDPSHVQDFARLAAQIALRYPDVKYFQVWNELKGMWSTSPGATPGIADQNRWDYERYTTLYNAVYDAVKQVRPDAQIGGPYVVIDSDGSTIHMDKAGPTYFWGTLDQRSLDVITYWLQHKHGADFITIDGSSDNTDGIWTTDEFSAAQKFIDVARWIRQQGNGGATLPLWWAEWYVSTPPNAPQTLAYDNALMASAEIATLQSGVTVALVWEPQGDSQGFSSPEGLWTDTRKPGGGQATPYAATLAAFKQYFGPGTPIYTTMFTSTITVLASSKATMLVNHLPTSQQTVVNGTLITLQPYEVRLVFPPYATNHR